MRGLFREHAPHIINIRLAAQPRSEEPPVVDDGGVDARIVRVNVADKDRRARVAHIKDFDAIGARIGFVEDAFSHEDFVDIRKTSFVFADLAEQNWIRRIAHVHNVRLMWLKSSAPELLEGLSKIEKEEKIDRRLLTFSLTASGRAIEELFRKGVTAGKIKGFKPGIVAFLGYLISHESHHRGQIALTVKQAGYKLDQKTAFGIWEWGVR